MSIVSIPADLTKGADPSPWTLDGTDLYTDSTSYLVAIGLTDPEAYLHVKAINSTTALKLNQAGSGATYKFMEFNNEAATTESYAPYVYSDAVNGYTRVRFVGSGGGSNWVFNDELTTRGGISLDGVSASIYTTGAYLKLHASTGFAMGATSFTPSGAMLEIRDASNAQLKLSDGTDFTTFKQTGADWVLNTNGGARDNIFYDDSNGTYTFKSNTASDLTVTLATGITSWSNIPWLMVSNLQVPTIGSNANVNGISLNDGLRFKSVAKTADYTMVSSDHVVFCDCPSGTPGMTITLPAASAGRLVKIVDNAGSCSNGANEIRITPASGTINGQSHVDIEEAYGSVFAICDGTNWTITN